jgi:hypothetical protein
MSAAPRITTHRHSVVEAATTICPGCRTELPMHATFCVECGLCMLEVTDQGTVVARAPTAQDRNAEPPTAAGRPLEIIDDRSSSAIELSDEDLEVDIDALVAGLLETEPPTPEDRMTKRYKKVSSGKPAKLPPPSRRSASSTLSSDLSETIADEIEVELTDADVEGFFQDISSPIKLDRGPLTPLSQWPAPPVGNTVVGPPPSPPSL